MSDIKETSDSNLQNLNERIAALENRLGKIESMLRIEWEGNREEGDATISTQGEDQDSTESRIVEYGLAWLGSIVFLFGIVFLMSYLESLGYPVISKATAYILTFLLITFAYFNRNSIPTLVYVLNICSYLLLYYITLKLHFFSEQPLLIQKGVVLILLLCLIGAVLFREVRKDSEFLASIAVLLLISTAIVSDSTYITFGILIITALTTHYLFYSRNWWRLHILSLFAIYLTHLIWLFNNPIMGNPLGLTEDPQHNILFLFGYAVIFSLSILIPKEKHESDGALISVSIWNALGASFLLLIIVPAFYQDTYAMIFIAIAAYCLLFAVALKLRPERKFAPAAYASFSFMALSIAVFGFFGLPDTFFLLALQSLLVISISLWFKSRIIVVANSILFISILLIYLITSESINYINFVFAFAALANARILGWQKERLTLKTEIFRNLNLGIAFFMILYSLNMALPSQYVTLSWIVTAIGFFILSVILGNIKYRYLAILAIIVTAGHLFFVDLGQMEILYRVIAFLLFAVISIGLSLYYTKRIRKK